jgi:hypothetical protein
MKCFILPLLFVSVKSGYSRRDSGKFARGPRPRNPLILQPDDTDASKCDIIPEEQLNYIVNNGKG